MKFTQFLIIYSLLGPSKASPWSTLTANISLVKYPLDFEDDEHITMARVQKHAEGYLLTMESLKLALVVFPEKTLGATTNPKTAVEVPLGNPCTTNTYPKVVKDLSCGARNSKTYMVVNLVEKDKCKTKTCYYSTNLVFDRGGSIIKKYRKYTIGLEGYNKFDRPDPEEVIFKTDFGVKFGIFTSLDILFKTPAQDLLKHKPDGIIFTTNWQSELPFLTALQVEQMWAYTHNIVLFSAGSDTENSGVTGTAVYDGSKGTILEEGPCDVTHVETLIYQSVNGKVPPPPPRDIDKLSAVLKEFNMYLATDPSIDGFSYDYLDTTNNTHKSQKVCDGDGDTKICCNFQTKVKMGDIKDRMATYRYFVIAFSGLRTLGTKIYMGVEICAVIACKESDDNDHLSEDYDRFFEDHKRIKRGIGLCGSIYTYYKHVGWPVTFEELTITAKFPSGDRMQYPNSLRSSLRPIDARETKWTSENVKENGKSYVKRTFSLKKPQNRLLTFAIYGRDFKKDKISDKPLEKIKYEKKFQDETSTKKKSTTTTTTTEKTSTTKKVQKKVKETITTEKTSTTKKVEKKEKKTSTTDKTSTSKKDEKKGKVTSTTEETNAFEEDQKKKKDKEHTHFETSTKQEIGKLEDDEKKEELRENDKVKMGQCKGNAVGNGFIILFCCLLRLV